MNIDKSEYASLAHRILLGVLAFVFFLLVLVSAVWGTFTLVQIVKFVSAEHLLLRVGVFVFTVFLGYILWTLCILIWWMLWALARDLVGKQ